MYKEQLDAMSNVAQKKVQILKDKPGRYLLSCSLGGLYICFGAILAFTLGGIYNEAGSPSSKIIMGCTFAIALALIYVAGADLFTSNTMVMGIGTFTKKTTYKDYAKVTSLCWLFNLVGALIVMLLLYYGDAIDDSTGKFIEGIVAKKVSLSIPSMIIKGTFCNVLVCLGIWCAYRLKNEAAKIIMILWCVCTFMVAGFEHSIANMPIMILSLLRGAVDVTIGGVLYNLCFVTIGNIIGGTIVVALSYTYMTNKQK